MLTRARRAAARLFAHRHRYRIPLPGMLHDPVTGHLIPQTRLFCRCGQEDPLGILLRRVLTAADDE